jgi:hypothetical protein
MTGDNASFWTYPISIKSPYPALVGLVTLVSQNLSFSVYPQFDMDMNNQNS